MKLGFLNCISIKIEAVFDFVVTNMLKDRSDSS